MAMVVRLPVGQGGFALGMSALLLVEKDRQRSHQRQIARGGRLTDVAMILALGVIAPIMLLDFDGPVATHQGEQRVGIGLVWVETADAPTGFAGGFDDLPPAQVVGLLVETEDLSGSRQAQRGSVQGLTPELALGNPPMVFIGRLGLRGENRPPAVVGLWPGRAVGCP